MESLDIPGALEVVVHDDLEQLSVAVARRIELLSAQAITARGRFCIALAGGETPRRCYERLREMHVDWKRAQLYFGDERCLPRGHAERNDSMVREALLDQIAVPPGNVHIIPAERGAFAGAVQYAALLEPVLPLDLVLLGMGEDGHVASLFPGNPAAEQNDIAVPVFDAPKLPAERVSLGMGTLNTARNKIFLIAGSTKQEALAKIVRGIALPAVQVQRAEWHVDRAALPAVR